MRKDPNKQQQNTYGSTKAAQTLYILVQNDPKSRRKVGRALQEYGTMLTDLDPLVRTHRVAAGLLLQEKLASISNMDLSMDIRTFTQNVLTATHRRWLRGENIV